MVHACDSKRKRVLARYIDTVYDEVVRFNRAPTEWLGKAYVGSQNNLKGYKQSCVCKCQDTMLVETRDCEDWKSESASLKNFIKELKEPKNTTAKQRTLLHGKRNIEHVDP